MTSILKRVFILSGLPASGKSIMATRIEKLYRDDGLSVFVYSTDTILEERGKELNKTYNEIFKDYIDEATKIVNSKLKTALKNNVDIIIWDQTNLSFRKRRRIDQVIPKHYIRSYHAFVPPTIDEDKKIWRDRLSSREGKSIPDHILVSMLKSYEIPGVDTNEHPVVYYSLFSKIPSIQ